MNKKYLLYGLVAASVIINITSIFWTFDSGDKRNIDMGSVVSIDSEDMFLLKVMHSHNISPYFVIGKMGWIKRGKVQTGNWLPRDTAYVVIYLNRDSTEAHCSHHNHHPNWPIKDRRGRLTSNYDYRFIMCDTCFKMDNTTTH